MKIKQILYIAGLFDGEGSCGIYMPTRITRAANLIVSIQMTSKIGLERIQSVFGNRICVTYPRRKNEHILYKLSYTQTKAEKILWILLPHLAVKAKEVQLVLETWEELKWAPVWQHQQIVAKYREKLMFINPAGARKGGRPKGTKDKRKRVKSVAVYSIPWEDKNGGKKDIKTQLSLFG